jgi:TatA/E family protein of Tat protein translocase
MTLLTYPAAFIEGIGGPEMIMILILVLVMFGGKKLPEFARGLGKSMKEFKKAASGVEEEFKRALAEDEAKKYVPNPPISSSATDAVPALPAPENSIAASPVEPEVTPPPSPPPAPKPPEKPRHSADV